MSVYSYDEHPGLRASSRQSGPAEGDGDVDAFLRRSVNSAGEAREPGAPDYDNDDFVNRSRADSLGSNWTRNSFGNPQQRDGEMFRAIQRMEGGGGHVGGIAFHRQPRVLNPVESGPWDAGFSSAASSRSSASSGDSAPAQRPGFRNGSWNPFRWNWRSLFGRGR